MSSRKTENSDSLNNEAHMTWSQTDTVGRSGSYWIKNTQKPCYRCSN